jgi:hypothetical protein
VAWLKARRCWTDVDVTGGVGTNLKVVVGIAAHLEAVVVAGRRKTARSSDAILKSVF